MIQQFLLNGKTFNVHVMSLKRSFEVKESVSATIVQSGNIYREVLGTYYNYSLTVREKDGDRAAFDAFWEEISKPAESHVCVFPYNQGTITQRMYVKSGSQDIGRLYADGAQWRDITIQFTAQAPKVIP